MENPLNRSDVIERLAAREQLGRAIAVDIVDAFFGAITATLAAGARVELRGFGTFSTRSRKPREGRNPSNGTPVDVPAKRVPHFKPGREIRLRVDGGR